MEWLKKYWKGKGFRGMTYFCVFAGMFFTVGTSFIDGKFNPIGFGFWAFYLLIVIPMAYIFRNNP